MERARQAGHRRMLLDTLRPMRAANALYSAMGFVEVEAYYANPHPEVVYYALEL